MADSQVFLCPACNAELNDTAPDTIRMNGVLRGLRFEVCFEFGIPAALGVYDATFDERLKMEEGCVVDFVCPHCGQSFSTGSTGHLAAIKLLDQGQQYVIVFNRVLGERSSFVLDHETKRLVASYGDDADAYVEELGKNVNFFGS